MTASTPDPRMVPATTRPTSPSLGALVIAGWLISAGLASGLAAPDVQIDWKPPSVDPSAFFFITLSISTPHPTTVVDPLAIAPSYFDGFDLGGVYERRETLANGVHRIRYQIRLVPQPGAPRFRMAPMALTWRNTDCPIHPGPHHHKIQAVTFTRQSFSTTYPPAMKVPARAWTPARFVLAILFLIVITTVAWSHRYATRHGRRTCPPDPMNAACIALRQWERLSQSSDHDMRESLERLRSLVRQWIQQLDPARSPTETSAETVAALRQQATQPKMWIDCLQIFFVQSEAILFSGQAPDPAAVSKLAAMAETLFTTAVYSTPNTQTNPETVPSCGC